MADQSPAITTAPSTPDSVLIDLGKQKRGKVKKLRKGKGSLADDVQDVIAELRDAGTIGAAAQTVIVVVERKPKKGGWLFNSD